MKIINKKNIIRDQKEKIGNEGIRKLVVKILREMKEIIIKNVIEYKEEEKK